MGSKQNKDFPQVDDNQLELYDISATGAVEVKGDLTTEELTLPVDSYDSSDERTAELRGGRYDMPDTIDEMRRLLGPTANQAGRTALTWAQKRRKAAEIRKATGRRVAPENIGLTPEQRRNLR